MYRRSPKRRANIWPQRATKQPNTKWKKTRKYHKLWFCTPKKIANRSRFFFQNRDESPQNKERVEMTPYSPFYSDIFVKLCMDVLEGCVFHRLRIPSKGIGVLRNWHKFRVWVKKYHSTHWSSIQVLWHRPTEITEVPGTVRRLYPYPGIVAQAHGSHRRSKFRYQRH